MISIDTYRTNAEDCLRLASTDTREIDRVLWMTLAQSWLRLAEHAQHISGDQATLVPALDPASETADEDC